MVQKLKLAILSKGLHLSHLYASLRRPSLVLKPNEIEVRLDSNVHTVRHYQSSRGAIFARIAGPRRNIELALWIRYQEKETEVLVEPAGVRTVFYCGVIEPTERRRKCGRR
ncbi:hypothetical protein ALC53_03766 [Atta colombica]|uniref:Uncharacterized protein n=1 Tax=Atta colombica TaxID=520822 RepID=A0A195BNN1_9HYME|nr:hypothetical protein ALC53_03766 [Atta colombica]